MSLCDCLSPAIIYSYKASVLSEASVLRNPDFGRFNFEFDLLRERRRSDFWPDYERDRGLDLSLLRPLRSLAWSSCVVSV